MRQNLTLALVLGSLLLAACQSSSASHPTSGSGGGDPSGGGTGGTPAPVAPSPTASMTVTDPAGGPGPFALADLEKLVITVDADHVSPGSHNLRIDVTSPGGKAYAQLPATLQASAKGQGRATTTLQVRGSVIASYLDVGTWQFAAKVDDAPLAASAVDLTE
jgi:hypothetical protein